MPGRSLADVRCRCASPSRCTAGRALPRVTSVPLATRVNGDGRQAGSVVSACQVRRGQRRWMGTGAARAVEGGGLEAAAATTRETCGQCGHAGQRLQMLCWQPERYHSPSAHGWMSQPCYRCPRHRMAPARHVACVGGLADEHRAVEERRNKTGEQ